MNPLIKRDLQRLDRLDQFLVLLHLLDLHTRRPALPAPLHFSVVAALCMFALLPLMPHNPLSIPIVIGGGISFAFLLQGGNNGLKRSKITGLAGRFF